MRLVGWPTNYKSEEELLPIDLQDVDLHASPEELVALIAFLEKAVGELTTAKKEKLDLNVGVDFGDDKPGAETGIWLNVVHHNA